MSSCVVSACYRCPDQQWRSVGKLSLSSSFSISISSSFIYRYTCGRNSYGQLGRKSEDDQVDIHFGKVEFPAGVKIQQIAAGNHHILAVDEKGLLYAWGFGDMQQLGNGKYEDEVLPYHIRSKELCVSEVN